MGLKRNKLLMQSAVWGVVVLTVVLGGCRLMQPQNGWNPKKWGPLVPHTSFPGDCSICHLPEGWDKLRDDFSFDHAAETGYPLKGAHAGAACLRCHNDRGPVTAYAARGCAGCHPDPHTYSMGMDCGQCHSELSWVPIGLISEHARTRFPLIGAHAVANCESCHTGAAAGRYQGAPLQCEVCHQDDLARAVSPNHLSNGWNNNCQDCHQPSGWNRAFITHSFFPLSGGHGGLDCARCHVGDNFSGLSTDCNACHAADYDAAPNHLSNNYSRNCASCHSINGWIPARIEHTSFPLQGNHNVSCNTCHESGNTSTFTCFNCHEHRKSEADSEHQGISGYVYTSSACYSCHPDGRD